MRRITQGTRTIFLLNDRADLAQLADADGVHLGQDDLSVAEARKLLGPGKLVGVSTHCLADAKRAVMDGANYIGCGPTFASRTKHFSRYAGLDYLREVGASIGLPAFAIGGLNLANLDDVLATGFSRIAVGDAVTGAADPAAVLLQLRQRLVAGRQGCKNESD